ncbi:MAG: MFS transporter [Oscillospiraceae bacterium]|nr:MFS transporter [Clostridiaceae bacterium]MDY5947835.1 MFS transporter [Oscillospiraceae bacterium]
MKIRNNFKHTMAASYLGYITQAIVNNFAPLLFVTFQKSFDISLEKIGYLVTVNFCIQLFVDFIAAKFVDKIGYRISIVAAHLFAGTGLILMGVLPFAFADPYMGLICAIVFYSIGGGLIEVLISPIVEACPTDKKSAAMSLLHSFYCWGHVAVILLTTLFFVTAGIENWRILSALWAVIPLANAVYFCFVPINTLVDCEKSAPIKELFKSKLFWILILLMICSGASEQGMSQWSSAFAETGLKVSKTLGDLLGPCMFAVMMGVSRVFYAAFSGRLKLMKFISVSCVFCVIGYLVSALSPVPALALVGCGICGLSVGILWPGVFSLAAERAPTGGTAMFAFLALAGDLGCSSGPTLVGIVSSAFNDNLRAGFLAAIAFPVALIIGIMMLKRTKSSIGGA